MASGQPQDQVLSTENLLFPASWAPERNKRMACGKNLSNPYKEKKGPGIPHIRRLCFLEGSESWSLSGGNTDTEQEGQGSPSKSGPHSWLSHPLASSRSYHMILCVSCLPFPLVGWLGRWGFLVWGFSDKGPLGRVPRTPQHSWAEERVT